LTEGHYRIRKDLAADSEATVEVTLQRERLQSIQLVRLTAQQIVAYTKTGELDAKLRRAIAKLGDLRHAVDQHQQRLDQFNQGRTRIFEEQKRIRDNLGRIPSNSDLYRRYLKKLNQQEDALERLDRDTAAAQAEVDAARDALTDYIAGLEM
jgi:biopolymer transport protein ExbB/TolQ